MLYVREGVGRIGGWDDMRADVPVMQPEPAGGADTLITMCYTPLLPESVSWSTSSVLALGICEYLSLLNSQRAK